MNPLLTIDLIVEPDRRQFARVALRAARALGGNPFVATARLVELLRGLRHDCERSRGAIRVELRVDGNLLQVACAARVAEVCSLPKPPEPGEIELLSERLRRESESADPELLRRRNEAISAQLEEAKRRAADELAELEAVLDRKKEELQESIRKAETDSLTGLLNRGAFDRRLADAIARCHRQSEPFSLILLDLDHFKEVNDTHGHQYGDRHLVRMGEAMAHAARDGVDHLCRIGGDEFAILVHADAAVAARIGRRVLELMDGGVSVGVAELLPDDDEKSLVKGADTALYAAKRAGRGRVEVASFDKDSPLEAPGV